MDSQVLIAVILFGASNLGVTAYFLGGMNSDVRSLKEWRERAESQISTLETDASGMRAIFKVDRA